MTELLEWVNYLLLEVIFCSFCFLYVQCNHKPKCWLLKCLAGVIAIFAQGTNNTRNSCSWINYYKNTWFWVRTCKQRFISENNIPPLVWSVIINYTLYLQILTFFILTLILRVQDHGKILVSPLERIQLLNNWQGTSWI